MADYSVRCGCGKETVVSEWALGAPMTCKACGRPLEATESNTRSVEAPRRPEPPKRPDAELPLSPEARLAIRHKPAEKSPAGPPQRHNTPAPPPEAQTSASEPVAPEAPPKPVITQCGRCGRTFRGDWDRYHRGDTVLCHICANLAKQEALREEQAAESMSAGAAPVIPEYKGVLDEPLLPEDDGGGGQAAELARQERIRRYVIVAAFVVLAVGLAVVLTDDTPLPPAEETAGEAAKPVPRSVAIAATVIMFLFRYVNLTAALYILLRWKDRLPSDFLLANILWLGVVAFGLQALGLVLLFVPFIGFFAWLGLCAYILWDLYDLDIADLLLLALFLFILQPLTKVVELLVLGILGLIFT